MFIRVNICFVHRHVTTVSFLITFKMSSSFLFVKTQKLCIIHTFCIGRILVTTTHLPFNEDQQIKHVLIILLLSKTHLKPHIFTSIKALSPQASSHTELRFDEGLNFNKSLLLLFFVWQLESCGLLVPFYFLIPI